MELSKLTGELELWLQKEREENTSKVIQHIQELLGVSLYEAAKTNNPIEAFNANYYFLLDKFEDILYQALEKSGISSQVFCRETIASFILSVTRNRSNVEFLKELLIKRNIISNYQEENGKICLATKIGMIQFQKLDGKLDEATNNFINHNADIRSACHESTMFLLEKNHNYMAVTAFARKNLGGKYLHSFILDGDCVIDLTANLYMKKEDYYKLYGIEEIRKVTYQEYLKDCEESKTLDESGTMFSILRNAMYSYFAKNI